MKDLKRICELSYYLMFCIFCSFVFVYVYSGETSVHENIILVFALLLLPLYEKLIDIIVRERNILHVIYIIALILFIFTGVYLLFGEKSLAESLSIYAYYFLIAGVVLQILYSFIQTQLLSHKTKTSDEIK